MKMHLFAGAALAMALATPALAQPASDTDWSGPYVGADLGAVFSHDHVDETTVVFNPPQTGTVNMNATEPVGGGLVGYNWEFPNHIVLGAEGDIEGSGVHRTSHCLVEDAETLSQATPARATAFPGSYFNSY